MDVAPAEELLPPGSPIGLDNCHREPIHTPGGIQPHGALLAVSGSGREIVQRSDNALERLGAPDELLGTSLDDLLGADVAAELTTGASGVDAAGLRPRTVQVGDRRFDAFGYAAGPGIGVVEFEPAGAQATAEALAEDVAGLLVALQSATTPQALLESAAAWAHRLTGFDRVWVYRFEADDHGVVIVEERADGLDPFLGLHFPARDIPPQARALFLSNRVRFIPDSFGVASPLIPLVNPVSHAWLDLSGGILRAVSPMHLTYLQNMGATASMSIALEVDGRLWGLISGHHYAGPRVVEHRLRLACEVLGRVVSSQLGSLLTAEAAQLRRRADQHREAILSVLASSQDDTLTSGLAQAGPALVEICAADGVAVVIGDDDLALIGSTPAPEAVRSLIAAVAGPLEEVSAPQLNVPHGEAAPGLAFVSESLRADLPELADALAPSCGAIVLGLARDARAHVAWFRDEYARSVTWGDSGLAPAKGRLSPTGSYATWSESVTGASRPWSATEREAVLNLRAGIGTVVLEQADKLSRANRELERSNADLEAFTFVVAHDMREPLRNMQSFLGFFLEDHGAGLDPDGMEQLQTIARLGVRMDALMDSLLHHARAGRLRPALDELRLGEVVEDAMAMLGPRSRRGQVEVLTPDVTLRADHDAMMHILINLISNAMKYSPGEAPRIEIGAEPVTSGDGERGDSGMVRVRVRDDGIGVPQEFSETIFELFRRLHPRDAYGGGSGAGLAIARRLAERQGGDLWLEQSTPGEGSVFCFTVPGV